MLNQLNFSSIVSSGSATTQLGVELMERYLGALQRNGESHILVNSFVKEASRLQYDAGIRESLEKVASFIGEQPIKWTWLLAASLSSTGLRETDMLDLLPPKPLAFWNSKKGNW